MGIDKKKTKLYLPWLLSLSSEMDFVISICDAKVFETETPLSPLLKRSSTQFVSNVQTTLAVLNVDEKIIPLTVNEKEYTNALICSPYTTYVTYPLGERKQFSKRWIKCGILLNAVIMGFVCRLTKINRIVQVNNHLNSLIRHPFRFNSVLVDMTKKLVEQYPSHAITFFRVNEVLDKELLMTLKKTGYLVFPDRSVHIFFKEKRCLQRSHAKRDLSLLRNTTYKIVSHEEFTESDALRCAELYRLLFIEKYSKLNPIYTEDYFREAILHRWHEFVGLRNADGKIDAFISWFDSEEVMSCGPLGYDTSVDSKVGLYRQLVALCLKRAEENQLNFNMGGGSDEFKLNRGSVPTLEYTAVYCDHLPFYRRIPWKIFSVMFNHCIEKVFEEKKETQ